VTGVAGLTGLGGLAAAGGPIDLPSWATMLTAFAGIAGVAFAFLGTRRGQNIEEKEKKATVVLEERVQGLKELELVLGERKAELADVRAGRIADAERFRVELAKTRGDAEREVAKTEARCTRQVERILDALDTLRSVVIDEVARTAASEAVGAAKRHLEVHRETATERALDKAVEAQIGAEIDGEPELDLDAADQG
jgi:hypothetical protein